MIQRQQTLWLLLAAILAFLSLEFPFYTGTTQKTQQTIAGVDVDGGSTLPLFLLSIVIIGIAIVAIFLFKTRKSQFWLVALNLAFSLLLLYSYYSEIKNYDEGHLTLTSLFSFAIPLCLVLALKGIRHDQKLVKSLDKLR